MIETDRYDPRLDREALKELFEDFIENKSYFISTWQNFEKELNKRVLDLQYRNSMIVAKEEGVIVGWGTYTLIEDYLGNKRALIHQILTKKEDSYRKGIEEQIIRELKLYIKRSLNLDKVFLICQDSDSGLRNLVMKLGAKKSKDFWYENEI
ncbi:MAG: GNAT family N-acetyltransferase [Candidatus Lokiarchaeota archaeon]|nr:GNAT family N-acetyltransferase [Candidatus Lokiarchaeota archaeon]